MEYTLTSLEDTSHFAKRLIEVLPRGAIIVLRGPLGAGKTTLVQALAAALGFSGRVTSPTYTLIHEYPTPSGLLVHVDAYHLDQSDTLFNLGLADYLDEAYLIAVEWGQPELFETCLEIQITPKEGFREVCITPHGALYANLPL